MAYFYIQTADINITEAQGRKLVAKIEKICHCYVMLKDDDGNEV